MQKKKGISLIVLVITYAIDEYGYQINNADYVSVTSDELYVPAKYSYWLASPAAKNIYNVIGAGSNNIIIGDYTYSYSIRPVVCLKATIPAIVGSGEYDFSLTK